ncbi:MAG: phage holin family protein [Puniceicoccaceae bacterium]|nr:MAG: phage holin family protein [Puniceicoccaceae bacterium]
MEFKAIVKAWLLIALGVLIASHIFAGIRYSGGGALFVAVLLLSLCNVFLKPLLMLFALPFIILTFGLGIWLINALLFLLVGNLVDGFVVDSFGYALAGALVVSLTGAAANALFGNSRVNVRVQGTGPGSGQAGPAGSSNRPGPKKRPLKDDDDVIDI